jgi:glycine betaine catabolism A
LAEARTLPPVAYGSPEVFGWERRHLLDGSWVCVGRTADVPGPGDQHAVRIGSTSILVVRDGDAAVRGYFNVCRHRGHELLDPGRTRRARGVKCPYHAWVYGLDGACRATPQFAYGPDDRTEFGLVPASVAEWGGWLFANVSGDAPPLSHHIGNLDLVTADYHPERLTAAARREYDVAANWKIIVENYLECYHCSSIHPALCRVTPPESDLPYPQPSTGVWVGAAMALREHALTMSLTGEGLGVPIPGLPDRRRREVCYVALLPNLLISLHPDYVLMHRLEPRAADRTSVECTWLFPSEAFERPDFSPDYAVEFWDVTNREDWRACQSIQRNVSSPGYRQGPVSPWEADVWRAMGMIARGYVNGRLSPVPAAVGTAGPSA